MSQTADPKYRMEVISQLQRCEIELEKLRTMFMKADLRGYSQWAYDTQDEIERVRNVWTDYHLHLKENKV